MKDIHIQCDDGYSLAASLYSPQSTPLAAIMIGPATGIKRQFYHHFANHLKDQGYAVLTYDNRGVAESLHDNINKSQADLVQWGRYDMTAALEQLKLAFPNTTYHLIGHSAGGQLVGLMPNAKELSSMVNFASSSGQLRNMTLGNKIKAHFFMNFFIPVSNALFGHTKSHWVGMGQPLPKGVARQWQKWCNGQGYVATGFGREIQTHLYDDLTLPTLWLNATDDFIAIDKNVADMTRVFTKAQVNTHTFSPTQVQGNTIGHMKFFSRQHESLWPTVTDWLAQHV